MLLPLVTSVLCAALVVPSTNKQEDQAMAAYVKVEIQGELRTWPSDENWSAIVDGKKVLVTIKAPGPRDLNISKHHPHSRPGEPPYAGPGALTMAKDRQELAKKPAGITWELVLGDNKAFLGFVQQHQGEMIVVKGSLEILEEYGGPDGKQDKADEPPPFGTTVRRLLPPSRMMVTVTQMELAKPKKK